MRPVMEYGSSVWHPQSILFQDELEKVQKRAARFAKGNYTYEIGSVTGFIEQLMWESLKKRRKDSRLIFLYKGLQGAASIPTDDVVPPNRRIRKHHSLAFQVPWTGTDIHESNCYPRPIKDWNSLIDFLICTSASENSVTEE